MHFGLDVGPLLDGGQFVHRLRVVGHRAVAVHRDGHRTHAEEAEGHQAEGEHGGHDGGLGRIRVDDSGQIVLRHDVGASHQADDDHADPEGGEVAGGQPGQDVQAGAAFARSGHHLADMSRIGRREDLDHFRNDGAGQRTEGDDQR